MSKEICVLKLVTGEEIIATVIDKGDNGVKLNTPLVVRIMQTQQGVGLKLVPWLMVEPDAEPNVSYANILTVVPASADTVSAYMRETTGLELPPTVGGSILHS